MSSAKTTGGRERLEQKAETRQRIQRAAWELFTTEGFEKTTTKAVAARAGVASGTVFVHASNKEDLLHLVLHDRLAEVVDERFATLPEGALVDRLLHVFGGAFALYEKHPEVAAAFLRTRTGTNGRNAMRMRELTLGLLHRIAGLVVEAQQRGEVASDVSPLQAAQNCFALYYMALSAWVDGYTSLKAALDPSLRSALELQVRGLRP